MALDLAMFSDKLQRYMSQLQVNTEELCQSTGIASAHMAGLLDGTSAPTGDEVLILADYFKCDYKFFISNERLAPFEQTESLFRKHGADLSREDRWAIQEFLFLCECQEYLLSELPVRHRQPFTFTKQGTFFKGQGQEAAAALRRHLRYGDNQVPGNVFQVFRDIGVHVFRRKLQGSSISGLCVRHPTAGRCVLVNYSEDVFRQRFTAAHETGHAILDDGEDFVVSFTRWDNKDLSEVRANTFASRFLIPPELLNALPDPGSLSEEQFLDIATRLMVNSEPLAYALKDAGFITEAKLRTLKGVRVPQLVKTDPELPESLAPRSRERKEELLQRGLSDSYVSLCFDAYDAGVISASRLAEMILVSESELTDLATLYGRALSHGN